MPKYRKVKQRKRPFKGYACVTWANGAKSWEVDGLFHREDGYAWEELDGTKEWYLNDIFLDKEWFKENPDKIVPMQAWELFEPEELVRLCR